MRTYLNRQIQAAKEAVHSPTWWRKRAIGLVISYCAVTTFAYFFQRQLMFPGPRADRVAFEKAVKHIKGEILAPFDAIVLEPPAGTPVVATAIWFHGNGGLGGMRASEAYAFRQRGIRLVLAEYPGYGPRDGKKTEASFVSDAKALYQAVGMRYEGTPLMLFGESLGSSIAAQVAADPGLVGPPSRVVLVTPLRNMPETAARAMWMFPARYLVKDRLDTEAALLRYRGPVTMLVAAKDDLVGPEQGMYLAKQHGLIGTKDLVVLPESLHNGWQALVTDEQWTQLLGLEPLAHR
jgi:uncharacterized protein